MWLQGVHVIYYTEELLSIIAILIVIRKKQKAIKTAKNKTIIINDNNKNNNKMKRKLNKNKRKLRLRTLKYLSDAHVSTVKLKGMPPLEPLSHTVKCFYCCYLTYICQMNQEYKR